MNNSDEWNSRYSNPELIYGIEPNSFLKKELSKLTPAKLLLPGEGEGRNALWAAKNGWEVTAFDFSEVAVNKANKLFKKNNVNIHFFCSDIQGFNSKIKFDAIGLVYLHLPSAQRKDAHSKMVSLLNQNGTIIIECYHSDQLGRFSGGPKNPDLFPTINELESSFSSLSILSLSREEITLNEGIMHKGSAVVIRMVAKKDLT